MFIKTGLNRFSIIQQLQAHFFCRFSKAFESQKKYIETFELYR